MRNGTMGSTDLLIGRDWLDPLEQQMRGGVHQFLQELIEQAVSEALGRLRHGRAQDASGYRYGNRPQTLFDWLVRPSGTVGAASRGAR